MHGIHARLHHVVLPILEDSDRPREETLPYFAQIWSLVNRAFLVSGLDHGFRSSMHVCCPILIKIKNSIGISVFLILG